jgi:hypothetical protein
VAASYSNIQWHEGNVWSGEGNINEDPVFLGSGDHPYQLTAGSPCIDMGNPDITGLHLPPDDLMGNIRIWGGGNPFYPVIDMGAYEFGSVGVGIPGLKFQVPGFRLELFPNPVSTTAVVKYVIPDANCQLPIANSVDIRMYDLRGVHVQTIFSATQLPGEYSVEFDFSGLPVGIYLVNIQVGDEGLSKILVKQ